MTRLVDAEDITFAIEENSIEMNGEQVIEVSCAKALIDFAQTFEERPQVDNFDVEDFKKFVESRLDMQDLYLPIHFFDLLDEYCGAKMKEADNEQ